MSMRRTYLLIPLMLALAGCQDATGPRAGLQSAGLHPRFAQGDGGVWTVNTLADPGDGTCDSTECTLREAIAAAASGERIVFQSGLQGDVDLTAGYLSLYYKSLTIDGAGRIAVDAQGSSIGIGVVGSGFPPAPVVVLAGLTFKNGLSVLGGGILASNVDLTLDSVTLSNNSASYGGGIYADLELSRSGTALSRLTLLKPAVASASLTVRPP